MSFSELVANRGTVAVVAERLKNNNLNKFTNMPPNVYHWRTFAEPVEIPPKLTASRYIEVAMAHERIYEVLLKLAPKMPKLNFCVDVNYDVEFNGMYVYEGTECVGKVEYTDKGALTFCNSRISNEMQRAGVMKTLSVPKAISIIRKYFYGMTKVEHFSAVSTRIDLAISSAHGNTSYALRRAKRSITEKIEGALFSNPILSQAMLQYLRTQNAEDCLEQYKDAMGTFELIDEMSKEHSLGKGLYVRAVGDGFETYRAGGTRVQTHRRDSMPDKVRGALGMLKLTEDSSFVDNAGFKFNSEKFWLTEEIANEFGS